MFPFCGGVFAEKYGKKALVSRGRRVYAVNMMDIHGTYDLHIHGGPEPIRRKFDFITLSMKMKEAGMAGFIAKNHFASTVPVASLAETYGADTIWGSVVLNRFAGGIDPNAVRASLGYERNGKQLLRMVWLPTLHAKANLKMLAERGSAYDVPAEWNGGVPVAGARPIGSVIPIDLTAPACLEPLKEIFDLMAEYDIALGTGHISREEIFRTVPLAKSRGVRSIVLTHPTYETTRLTDEEMIALTREYDHVYAEMCYTFTTLNGVAAEEMASHIRKVGPEKVLLSTDSGQRAGDAPYVCMQKWLDMLANSGFTEEELRIMCVRNARDVLGL